MTLFWYGMRSQKVPGIMVLHCDARTYGNACLISFTVGPLRVQTFPLSKASFGIGRRIRSYALHDSELCPLEARIPGRAQPKVAEREIRRV
jgi:hypothetical protein